MKTSSNWRRFCFAAACLALLAGAARASAGQAESGSSGPLADLERIGAIIRGRTGTLPAEAVPLPVIKWDRLGRAWASWQTWDAGRGRIELARFGRDGIEESRLVGLAGDDAVSPDFDFSPEGQPWIIWLDARAEGTRVLVLDVASQRTYSLIDDALASVGGPRILFDAGGSPWTFWNVTSAQTGEIFYRTFAYGKWTAPAAVPRETRWPALNPDAAVDSRGTIWLTWSGYNGRDYGIYLTQWAGIRWAAEVKVSENPGPNLFPSLGFDSDGSPLVSWIRASAGGRAVCLNSYRNGTVGREQVLGEQSESSVPPRLIQESGGPVLSMKSGEGITVQSLSQRAASPGPSAIATATAPRLTGSLELYENRYIGFGDSITFGYIDYYPFPERGYIPRLETILNTNYGSQRVINEGWGGEVTADGLLRIDKVFIADLARYILIMEGTNDVIFDQISMDSAAFNLRQMVNKCLAVGAFPAIATIVPRFDWFGTQSYYRNRLLSLNTKIRKVAADLAVPLVDMYTAFSDYSPINGGVLSLLSTDLKHPSDKGYQFMAETWFSGIQNFPFPPAGIDVGKLGPERPSRNTKAASGKVLAAPLQARSDPRQPFGNLLTWAHSPKIKDPTKVLGYRIYRKNRSVAAATYDFLAFVEQPLEYFDRGITALTKWSYVISTVRRDGIEGPISDPVQ